MRDAAVVFGAVLVLFAGFGVAATPAAAGPSGSATDGHCSYPVTVTDATDAEVTVDEEPGRVVALAPSAAQILWAIDARDKVVGMPVDYFTGYLNGTDGKTNVMQDDGTVIQEQVVGTEPDLVLAPNVIPNETVESLRESGLTVYKFESPNSLKDVYAKIELYGRLVGNYDEAGRVSADVQGQAQAIEEAVSDEENPRVYYDLGFGWTAGENTFVGDIIAKAGGDNIAAGELERPYGELSQEVIADKDPEWILVSGLTRERPKNPAINDSTAVEEGNVVHLDSNFINQNGPKNLQPLKKIAAAFHPEAYDSIDFESVEGPEPVSCTTPTPTPSPTSTPSPTLTATPADGGSTAPATATATDGGTPTDVATPTATESGMDDTDEPETTIPGTTASEAGPGFTALSGLVAALVAGLLVRRRE